MQGYEELMDEYVAELGPARDAALAWWNAMLAAAGDDPDAAYTAVRLRWPAGPASYPGVLAVYRKYFFRCHSLNERILEEQEARPPRGWGEEPDADAPGVVPPNRLLIDSVESVDAELGRFVSALVFVPIGRDPDGNVA